MTAALNLAGQKFGKLTVVRRAQGTEKRVMWLCKCECGGDSIARGSALTDGNTRSCGCLVREKMAATGRANGTHNLSRTPEYGTWGAMIRRCYDPNNNRFKYYGAMGVTVCDRWRHSFDAFLADMGRKPSDAHSIDRINPYGNYEPGNCRWATPIEQRNNRRA